MIKNCNHNDRVVDVVELITLFLIFPIVLAALLTIFTSTNYASLLFNLLLPASLYDSWIGFVSYMPYQAFPDEPINILYALIVRVTSAAFIFMFTILPVSCRFLYLIFFETCTDKNGDLKKHESE